MTGCTDAAAGVGGALDDGDAADDGDAVDDGDAAADGDAEADGDGVAVCGGGAALHCTSTATAASVSASTAHGRLKDVNWDDSSRHASKTAADATAARFFVLAADATKPLAAEEAGSPACTYSGKPEDTKITHDYLSIALEFDDGQDLTWYWSGALPEGFAYRCPLDYWRKRETHIVVRTGATNLGSWVDEERDVLADHQAAIGGLAPARVVNAWIIGVSLFQGGRARAGFRDIELVDGDTVLRIG